MTIEKYNVIRKLTDIKHEDITNEYEWLKLIVDNQLELIEVSKQYIDDNKEEYIWKIMKLSDRNRELIGSEHIVLVSLYEYIVTVYQNTGDRELVRWINCLVLAMGGEENGTTD